MSRPTSPSPLQRTSAALAALAVLLSLSGCVLVGGYSSRGGFFIWPGSIVITLIFLALFFLFRRRR